MDRKSLLLNASIDFSAGSHYQVSNRAKTIIVPKQLLGFTCKLIGR